MVKFVNASEAARRIGVTDKTVRSWIIQGKLDAHHVSKNRLAIAESDVERLARERRLYASEHTPNITALAARIEALERTLEELSERYRALEARIRDQETREPAYISQLGITHEEPAETRQNRTYAPREKGLPEGAMLARHFAQAHGVNPNTFRGHYEPGKGIRGERLIISSRPKPGRDEMEWFVTTDDAPRILDYWRRHNVTFTE